MEKVLVIGNENLEEQKNKVALRENSKDNTLCFVAKQFNENIAKEHNKIILVDDNEMWVDYVLEYLTFAFIHDIKIELIKANGV
ncbi:MAG: hypothetical protein M0P71_01715 [Melioribacteraceae bacterium]|nr:hypothetical protein [Melioribacteraceae bacterium]